jgi:parvulin-like peptidyl-prolyl isomerase
MTAVWTVAACLVSCMRSPEPPSDAVVVVATVNGAPITLKDLKTEIAGIHGVTPSMPARSGTRAEVSGALRQLIERAVVLQEGKRLGIAVNASEVEEEVKRYRSDFPAGGMERSLLQEGIEEKEWRERLRLSLLYRNSAEAIALPLAKVEEEEVRRVFRETFGKVTRPERIRIRQLLFESRETAAKAREALAEGIPPDVVRDRFSTGENAPLDINLGFLTREELPEEVAAELFGLPEGGVSSVMRRGKTHSVFLVVRKTPRGPHSYAEKAPQIRRELLGRLREKAFRKWLEAEVGKADVKVHGEILAGLTEGRK